MKYTSGEMNLEFKEKGLKWRHKSEVKVDYNVWKLVQTG